MSSITEYAISNQAKWDDIVRSFPDYDVFYLSGYAKAFMLEDPQNGIPVLLYYENGDDRAVDVVFKRDIALDPHFQGKLEAGRYFDLITPYGYGGFQGSIADWDALNQAYAAYCQASGCVCEFVRFSLFSAYSQHYAGAAESRTRNVVRSLDLPLDEMWMDFKQKVRKNVKKASAHQLGILIEPTDAHLDDFLRIYYGTMDRTNAADMYYFSRDFFERLAEMRDHVMFFHAVHEGKIISTELVIFGAESCYSYLGGTDNSYYDLRPNDFLKYEIIKWAQEKGLKRFILGGGYGEDDGIFQYKLSFAPHGVQDFYIGHQVFDQAAYDMLVRLRDGGLNEKFFPLYRS